MLTKTCIFLLLKFGVVYSNIFGPHPRIYVENGNLKFQAPEHKNVTFETSGVGGVFFNGRDLTDAAKKASAAAERIRLYSITAEENFQRYDRYGDLIEGTNGILNRLQVLERNVINGSVSNVTVLEKKEIVKDECASNPCKHGATCRDLFNEFLCQCPPEWEGPLCDKDVNECARFAGTDLGCQNGATCINKPGGYECSCTHGWFGIHCTRRSADCSSGSPTELCGHGTCISQTTGVGYKCICDQGWTTDGTNPACTVDVNECTLNHPPCSVEPPVACINVPGSFYCGNCPQGYSGNGYYCADINECSTMNGGCSMNPMVACINTPGSRICGHCPPGFVGDGVTCNYQGVCAVNNGGCYPSAQCRENPRLGASFVECICPAGYTGSGVGPTGCTYVGQEPQNACGPFRCVHGFCSVSGPAPVCICLPGYEGPNCDILKNLCASNPCQNGGTCRPVIYGAYRCICTSGFTGDNCQEERQSCGGQLKAEEGTLKYPLTETYNHRVSCAWTIETNATKVLKVTFTHFNLESSRECQFDFLQIHDGRNAAAHSVGRFCGQSLPNNGEIISTHNILYLWFRSDHSISRTGFELNWTTIEPVCGGSINVDTHGSISSPGSPGNYPSNRDCLWYLSTSPQKRILFHFFQLIIGDNSDCSKDYLEFSFAGKVFAKYCNTSHPEPLYSPGSEVVVYFHSDETGNYPGFQITYSAVEGLPGCGGTFTLERGEIRSPGYDGEYPPEVTCEYKIQLSEKSRIKITFISFNLEESSDCSADYVELYDGVSTNSPIIGRYCGSSIPAPYISNNNVMLIVFVTDWAVGHEGFHIRYESICGGQFTESTGVIESPGYPSEYLHSRQCIYEIIQPLSTSIVLRIDDFDLEENSYPQCQYDFLEIRDGHNENATLIGRYCRTPPREIFSTYNYLWLKFESDRSISGKGFHLTYSTINLECGGILKDNVGTISSSDNINGYEPNMNCKWIIVAPFGHVIQLTWIKFDLEKHSECTFDYVEVYENNTITGKAQRIGKYCGQAEPPSITSSFNIITIIFVSDSSVNELGFLLSYTFVEEKNVCGGNYFSPSGVIKSPNFPNPYDPELECIWIITVNRGEQIQLNVTDFVLESNNCRYDFLEIRNGRSFGSPLIGIYCGMDIPKQIISHTNNLYLRFKSDSSRSERGFQIYWEAAATGCGGLLTSPDGSIVSPNYPESYEAHTECIWKISTSKGSSLQIFILDLDLEVHFTCALDYLEFFEVMEIGKRSLGKYCSTHPTFLSSVGNKMTILFHSDVSLEGRGFHLHYKSICNNTLKGFRGVIESPNFPNTYQHNLSCVWHIEGFEGNAINISFSHMDIEQNALVQHCNFDYVEIQYIPVNSDEESETKTVGKYCGTKLPEPIHIPSNQVIVIFKTDVGVVQTGFRLEWYNDGCGGILSHPEGSFTTPRYPKSYPISTECNWTIQVEPGKHIELTFLDVDMETSDCAFDYIMVVDGPDPSYPTLTHFCTKTSKPVVVKSSTNTVLVHFKSDASLVGRGFSAKYKTVPAECGGEMTAPTGVIHSPNYPNHYEKNTICEWSISVEDNYAVVLTFEDVDMYRNNCSDNYIKIFDGPTAAYPVLQVICGDKPNNSIIASTNNMFIEMKGSQHFPTKGFLAKYRTSCGVTIRTLGSGQITYDREKNKDQNETCAFTIISQDPSEHIKLTVTHMKLGNCSFNENGVTIYNGASSEAPILGNYCGDKIPRVISGGSALHIVVLPTAYTFFFTYSVVDSACGGTFLAVAGEFSSPGYPLRYEPNMQCEWTIQATPGYELILQFIDMDIIDSDKCNGDYVEVRKRNRTGELIGFYCGNQLPLPIKNKGDLWILFESKSYDGSSGKGFLAEFTFSKENELIGDSGQIASLLYPQCYIYEQNVYSWRIIGARNSKIILKFIDLFFTSTDCDFSLSIYDGYSTSAPLLKTICDDSVTTVESSTNVLFIKHNSYFSFCNKFFLEWQQISVNRQNRGRNNTCGSNEIIDISNMTYYNFSSPGFPRGYGKNLKCEWIFTTKPEKHMELSFTDLDLEVHYHTACWNDKISVYSGNNIGEMKLVSTFCTLNSSRHLNIPFGTYLKVTFDTNDFGNGTGFAAKVLNYCGGNLQGSGTIVINNLTSVVSILSKIECKWNITVKPGRTILFEFTELDIGQDKSGTCENYVMLRNGIFPDSPILGSGKYCGNRIPSQLLTTSNYASVRYKGLKNVKGFVLKYTEISQECGGQLKLTQFANSTILQSPNFPEIPPPHIECAWTIYGIPGERIKIDFKFLDLTRTLDCKNEYVEVRDGGTSSSTLIDRYCQNLPSTIFMSDNVAYLKFFTDVEDPRSGFQAEISIATCGGTLRADAGVIYYPPIRGTVTNENCMWHIIGPIDHTIMLRYNKVRMSCQEGYVSISEFNKINETTNELQRLCDQSTEFMVPNNDVFVKYQASSSNVQDVFTISFNATQDECGGKLNTETGVIESPGYPKMNHFHRNCEWEIEVPKGRRVTFELLDFDLDESIGMDEQGMAFFDGRDFVLVLILRGGNTTRVIESTDNVLVVYFWSSITSSHRGFKARYTSDKPTFCNGDFSQTSGVLLSPQNVSLYYCEWERSKLQQELGTLVLRINIRYLTHAEKHFSCRHSASLLEISYGNIKLGQFCQTTQKEIVLHYPNTNKLMVTAKQKIGNFNFTVTYNINNCGGFVEVGTGYIDTDTNLTACSWLLKQPDYQQIKINFTTFNVIGDCDRNYVTIFNGKTQAAPRIGTFCANKHPNLIRSQGSYLLVQYTQEDNPTGGGGFKMNYEPAVDGCGGIFHDSIKAVESPGYPKNYPNNAECLWEIHLADGYTIHLKSDDRFHLEDSDNCSKDFLEAWDWVDDKWVSLGKRCGRQTPMYNSTTNKLKILFRSDNNTSFQGFKLTWTVSCGGVFKADHIKRYLVSPGYPEGYSNNLACQYNIISDNKFMYITFEDFLLERANSGCKYDNLTIMPQSAHIYSSPSIFCGDNSPPNYRAFKTFTMVLKTDNTLSRKGFRLSYQTEYCGSVITEETEIASVSPNVKYTNLLAHYPSSYLYCVWNVTAPPRKLVVMQSTIFRLHALRNCVDESVEVFDVSENGSTTRLAKLCGNLSKKLPIIQSSGNKMMIMYSYMGYLLYQNREITFKANIYFTYGPADGCGGDIFITESNNTIIRGSKYENQDCHWRIASPLGYTIQFSINELNLPARNNCANYIQLKDGYSSISSEITKICNNTATATFYTTSKRYGFLRFVTETSLIDTPFKIRVTAVRSKCGLSILNATTTPQYLTSPDFPQKYPSNIRCSWIIFNQFLHRKAIFLKFLTFDLLGNDYDEYDNHACNKDRVEITENSSDLTVSEGLGTTLIYNERDAIYGTYGGPTGTHQFCGKAALEFDYYLSKDDKSAVINFISESVEHGSGFKLQYMLADCNRNYTGIQGKIKEDVNARKCYILITVPEGRKISIYYDRFSMTSYMPAGGSCLYGWLRIYDGNSTAAPLLAQHCSQINPAPTFSTTNNVLLHINTTARVFGDVDITYTSSTKPQGCGGIFFNYRGVFTSPLYPNSYRNDSECIYDIRVPLGLQVAMKFVNFDIMGSCNQNYVVVTTYSDNVPNAHKFCSSDEPAEVVSTDSKLLVRYVTTANNGGTGWVIKFLAHSSGTRLVWY